MHTLATTLGTTVASVLGAIAWNPEIRNILSVLVGVVVLCGSVYLLVGTNVGSRTGLLVSLAGFFGWMAIMGVIWWIYGIGMLGSGATWHVEELNYSSGDYAGLVDGTLDEVHRLTALAELPSAQELIDDDPAILEEVLPPDLFEAGNEEELAARTALVSLGQIVEVRPELAEQYDDALDGWTLLPVSDRQRGDAAASADAFLGPDGRGVFESSAEYVVRDVFSFGGKPQRDDDSLWNRLTHEISTIVKFRHPAHFAVVQVQAVEEFEVVPGQATPTAVIDADAPVLSVVLERDLGDRRFPAAMTTISSTLLFALFAWMLHRRDAVIAEVRAASA